MKSCKYLLIVTVYWSSVFVSCAQKNKEQIEVKKQEEVEQTTSEFEYKVVSSFSSTNEEGIPEKSIDLVMPNDQKLFIARVIGKEDILTNERASYGIPTDAVFAFKSYYAGGGTIYYGLFEDERLYMYEVYYDESGTYDDPKLKFKYAKIDGTWFSAPIKQINDWVDYRNQEWKPEKGQYYFSEQFVYEYTNDLYPEEDPLHKGEFSFFHDPITGTILLRREDSFQDEMMEFVMVRPKEDYIISYSQEHGIKIVDTIAQDDFYQEYPELYKKDIESNFEESYTLLSQSNYEQDGSFNKDCLPNYLADDYRVNFQNSNDQSTVSLADYPHDLTNLYLLQKSKAMPESGLLIHLSGSLLPGNKLLVQDNSLVSGKKVYFRLKCIYPSSHYIYLMDETH